MLNEVNRKGVLKVLKKGPEVAPVFLREDAFVHFQSLPKNVAFCQEVHSREIC